MGSVSVSPKFPRQKNTVKFHDFCIPNSSYSQYLEARLWQYKPDFSPHSFSVFHFYWAESISGFSTPNLTFLLIDSEVSCKVRPPFKLTFLG